MTREGRTKRANEKQRAREQLAWLTPHLVSGAQWPSASTHHFLYSHTHAHTHVRSHTHTHLSNKSVATPQTTLHHDHVAGDLQHCPHIWATQAMLHYKSVSPANMKPFCTEAIIKTSDPKAGLRLTTLVLVRVEITDILQVLFLISLESSSVDELLSIWEPGVVQLDRPIWTTNTTSMTT